MKVEGVVRRGRDGARDEDWLDDREQFARQKGTRCDSMREGGAAFGYSRIPTWLSSSRLLLYLCNPRLSTAFGYLHKPGISQAPNRLPSPRRDGVRRL